MNDDQPFRLILLAGFVIFMPIGVWHRLKSRTGEKLDRRQEGWFILVTPRPVGIAGMFGLIAYLLSAASCGASGTETESGRTDSPWPGGRTFPRRTVRLTPCL